MSIKCEEFGTYSDEDTGQKAVVKSYTFSTTKGIVVKVISFGATISSVKLPDKNGLTDYVTLGFDRVEDYARFNYIGTTIGRFGNRIKNGKFSLNGNDYQLTINNNTNHLHGGTRGWNKHVWESYIDGNSVIFSHVSPDGDQGYPGTVLAQVTYSLSEDGSLKIDYQAMSTKPTPINMTNHSFFNLAGHSTGQKGLFEHEIQVFADCYLPVSPDAIPTGVIQPVKGTAYNLQHKQLLGKAMALVPDKGYDHCFCLNNITRGTLHLAAEFYHPPSGRLLEVFTTEPGAQIYTGNFIPKEPGKMVGRGGTSYTYQGAFCCEPQNFPDAVNQKNFPDSILYPGRTYNHSIIYKFGTK